VVKKHSRAQETRQIGAQQLDAMPPSADLLVIDLDPRDVVDRNFEPAPISGRR
jgi:hypothetical protein